MSVTLIYVLCIDLWQLLNITKTVRNSMNLDPILDRHIDAIQNRLTNVKFSFFGIAGETLRTIYTTPHDQLPSLLYSGKVGEMTSADLHRIKVELSRIHRQNVRELYELFNDLTAEVYSEGQDMGKAKGVTIATKKEYRQAVNPLLEQIRNNYAILGMSTIQNTERQYRDTINKFAGQLLSDTNMETYPSIMRSAIRELTENGISTVSYKSGRNVRMDTAVRNSLMSEYTNVIKGVQTKLAEDIGTDGWEISAHIAPADDHADIQGAVFENSEYEKLQNHEPAVDIDGVTHHLEKRAIGEFNCMHIAFPFMIGVSERAYSQEDIDRIEANNERGVTFRGEHLTLYESTQLQRQLETSMRYERERNNLLKEVRDIPEFQKDYQRSRARLAGLRNEYKELGEVIRPAALRSKMERSYVPRGSTGSARL